MEYPSDGLLEAIAELEERSRQEAEIRVGYEVLDFLDTSARRAAVVAEQLKVMGKDLDYAQTRKKGQLLTELEVGELYRFHPSAPTDFKELLAEVGISKSEASDLIAWERHLYPYIQSELGITPWVAWHRFGKTKLRRMTPYLRQVVDDQHQSRSDKVLGAIDRLNERIDANRLDAAMYKWECDYASAVHAGVGVIDEWAEMGRKLLHDEELTPEETEMLLDAYDAEFPLDRKKELVVLIMDIADTSTTADYNANMSPEQTPMLEGITFRHRVITDDGEYEIYKVSMELSADQYRLLTQRMDDRMRLAFSEGRVIDKSSSASA